MTVPTIQQQNNVLFPVIILTPIANRNIRNQRPSKKINKRVINENPFSNTKRKLFI